MNRFWPNFVKPRRFSEKLWSRQLHERSPKLTMISDKLLVRDYAASKVGVNYLVPLLWLGGNPEKIPFDELPNKFVIKTNHGCGYNIIVFDNSKISLAIVYESLTRIISR
ncbi:ATP-grasp fold amidoligase family protein [Macellibacteroides fermentans]|uniref:ATP-grasp fold amidoligase family protein n=1 Tax=Macellibacteroides fermentans TaxID=879969 RepID=UPI00406C9A9B